MPPEFLSGFYVIPLTKKLYYCLKYFIIELISKGLTGEMLC